MNAAKHILKSTEGKARDIERINKAFQVFVSSMAQASSFTAHIAGKIAEIQAIRGASTTSIKLKRRAFDEKTEEIYRPIYKKLGFRLPGSTRTARLRKKRRTHLLKRLL